MGWGKLTLIAGSCKFELGLDKRLENCLILQTLENSWETSRIIVYVENICISQNYTLSSKFRIKMAFWKLHSNFKHFYLKYQNIGDISGKCFSNDATFGLNKMSHRFHESDMLHWGCLEACMNDQKIMKRQKIGRSKICCENTQYRTCKCTYSEISSGFSIRVLKKRLLSFPQAFKEQPIKPT